MSVARAYQVSIGVFTCVLGMSAAANQNQIESVEQGLMRAQTGYPPLQQTMPSPSSNTAPRADSLPPVYPAETTDATGDYPPIGYEPETGKQTARSPRRRAGGVQQSAPAQFPQRPPARQPQVPQPYSSQDLNVWTPAIGGFSGPAAPPPPTAPSEYPSPPARGTSAMPEEIPIGAPSAPQPTTGEYPPLADETSSGYPYSRAPQSAAPRAAQRYRGGPPPLGYRAYPPGPHGPYPPPPPPYYGGPPYPGRW